jgi:hypothetical protein
MTVWLVTLGDTEKNFRTKREAVAWLVRLTHDEAPVPLVRRDDEWRYCYLGPVTHAWIDKLGFPDRAFYAPKKRGQQKLAATVVDGIPAPLPRATAIKEWAPIDPRD